MIERARAALAAARAVDEWPDLAYVLAKGPDGHDCDGNAWRRALVLWGMQYDWQIADLRLLRFVCEQEALCRSKAPFSGTGEEYGVAGYLLARHRDVSDVWRQWALKTANFDTDCGYDVEAVVAAGVAPTLAYVSAADHPERERLLERLLENGRPVVTEDEVAAYFTSKAEWFPDDPVDEPAATWDDRAELLSYWGV